MDRNRILKMVMVLAAIIVLASGLARLASRNSLSLAEYQAQHAGQGGNPGGGEQEPSAPEQPDPDFSFAPTSPDDGNPTLTGASLNGSSCLEQRVTLAEGFYYEPLSDKLRRYITGVSFPAPKNADDASQADPIGAYPAIRGENTDDTEENTHSDVQADTDRETDDAGQEDASPPAITLDELCYVHILYYSFEDEPVEGELICNSLIARDLVEIFHELYRNEYKLERVLLIDEYDGNETASMEDGNTYCFFCPPEEGGHAARHARGLAVDINPLYNPCVTYTEDGTENVTPASSAAYADRSVNFPYKIDENDLCYKLFIRHGFTWGGHWNDGKAFQHFQKTPKPETAPKS